MTAQTQTRTWSTTLDDTPVSLSVAGDVAALGGAGGEVRFLDLATGAEVDRISAEEGLLTVALSPTASHAVTTGMQGYALWHRGDDRPIARSAQGWSARAVWASPEKVAVACGRRAIVLDTAGTQLWETAPAASTVTDLAWTRKGRRLAVAAYGEIRAHERHQERPVMVYPYIGSHLALAISPNEQWICCGNQDASIHIWRARDASELTMSGYSDKVTRLAFDDTGRWLASDGAPDINVWDFSGKGPAGTAPRSLQAHERITALAWRPGPHAYLASGGHDGTIALWHAASGRPRMTIEPLRTFRMSDSVVAVTWAGPDRLVTADRTGRIDLLDLRDEFGS
ncbi:WD40 repeat domain-containing protein [Nocardia grenadensis]